MNPKWSKRCLVREQVLVTSSYPWLAMQRPLGSLRCNSRAAWGVLLTLVNEFTWVSSRSPLSPSPNLTPQPGVLIRQEQRGGPFLEHSSFSRANVQLQSVTNQCSCSASFRSPRVKCQPAYRVLVQQKINYRVSPGETSLTMTIFSITFISQMAW